MNNDPFGLNADRDDSAELASIDAMLAEMRDEDSARYNAMAERRRRVLHRKARRNQYR